MRFDDRLLTVLELATPAPHDRAVQWRQLVELVARSGSGGDVPLRRRALARIAELGGEVPASVRAAAARAIAGQSVPAELVAIFAADSAEIAAPLLTAAELDPDGWAEVRAAASASVRALLSAIRPEPPPEASAPATPVADLPPAPVPLPAPERAFSPAAALDLRVPERPQAAALAPSEPGLFRWECGVTGEIDWVEGAPRAALIGRSISEELNGRFSARLPFSDEALAPAEEGPLAGEWRWSGAPAFFPDTGRFAGYRGIARRNDPARAAGPSAAAPTPMDSDSLRELIHELRTPLNAIIGFGEMIDGQFLGPAHSAYRDRAAQIVRQARRLLGAVDDLDFAAKLQSGRVRRGTGTPLDTLFPLLNDALTEQALARGVSLRTTLRCGDQRCALELALAERLLRRFGEAVISAAATGEHLELVGERAGRHLAVSLNRPLALRGMEEEAMLDPSFGLEGSAGIGTGFALRLVRGLATMAGGGLDFPPERLVLLVPLAAD